MDEFDLIAGKRFRPVVAAKTVGAGGFRRVLQFVTAAWPQFPIDQPGRFRGVMLRGINRFDRTVKEQLGLDITDKRVFGRFRDVSPEDLARHAASIKEVHRRSITESYCEAMAGWYNRRLAPVRRVDPRKSPGGNGRKE